MHTQWQCARKLQTGAHPILQALYGAERGQMQGSRDQHSLAPDLTTRQHMHTRAASNQPKHNCSCAHVFYKHRRVVQDMKKQQSTGRINIGAHEVGTPISAVVGCT